MTYQPGHLPGAFRDISLGNLVLDWAWHLYAFSAYPFPTQLPCDAAGATTGAPAVGSTRSSRTKVDFPQISYARIR